MNNKEIHELVKLINETDLAEFKLSKGDFSVTIRSKDYFNGKAQPMAPIMPVAPAPAPKGHGFAHTDEPVGDQAAQNGHCVYQRCVATKYS